jgi:hypothetical protein
MGKYERNKGNRVEREIVQWHRQLGIFAERVPLSGGSHYRDDAHDVDVYPWGRDDPPLVCEVKARKDGAGFALLRRWIAKYDALFLREDNQDDLVVLPCRVWAELLDAVHSTNTRRKPKSELGVKISGRPAKPRRRGDGNEHPVEP